MEYRKLMIFLGVTVILWAGMFSACTRQGFVDYTSEQWGYTIRYPYSWKLEISTDGKVCVGTAPSKKGSFRIDVIEGIPAQEAAQRWLMAIGTAYKEVVMLENKPSVNKSWDWYLAYEYETEFYGTFHGEAFFRQLEGRVYKIDTLAEKSLYEKYPFPTIVSSFKLKKK